ncbi:MAG: type III-B CRISPR module RAMP protein Cmr4 [Bacteroidota bacterium]
MFKSAALLFFHAETSVHAGSGQSFGGIDLAIQRERHTEFPMIAASGVKGASRDWFSRKYPAQGDGDDIRPHQKVAAVFGPDTRNASAHAGAVSFTDARTLLFPVRSFRGVYAWTTCSSALARLRRDVSLLEEAPQPGILEIASPPAGTAYGSATQCDVSDEGGVLLEEYAFSFQPREEIDVLATWLRENAFPGKPTGDAPDAYQPFRDRLASHLLVLHDDDFADFVRYATEIQARVALNEKKTTTGDGGNLFYQENLPADTVLYAATLASRDLSGKLNGNGSADHMLGIIRQLDGQRIQLGGDETVGKGICCTRYLGPSSP